MKILCIGDICGASGLRFAEKTLPSLRKSCDFVVANGENIRGMGLSGGDCHALYNAGVDVITLGNHAFGRKEILDYIEDDRYLLRPSNFTSYAPGRGFGVFDAPNGQRVAVINLIGRLFMDANYDNPFFTADEVLKKIDTPIIIVDFHAEATSEKLAMGYYLDGRASAVFGTHTHVATADARVLPGGTGYITDAGMCGPRDSVLGMKPEASLARFLGRPWRGERQSDGAAVLQGVVFEVGVDGRCINVEAIEIL